MENNLRNIEFRTFLIRKLLTISPVCQKKSTLNDIDILNDDISKINHWPLTNIHCHASNNIPLHALTLYLNAGFSGRGNEVSNFLKIDYKEK